MRKLSQRLEVAKKMPPLRHSLTQPFDPQKSEVVQWLVNQPEILNYLFDAVRGNGYRETAIIFDDKTGTWQGIDYEA